MKTTEHVRKDATEQGIAGEAGLMDGMSDSEKPIQGYHLIKPEDLHWRPFKL